MKKGNKEGEEGRGGRNERGGREGKEKEKEGRILMSCSASMAPIKASSCVSFTGRLMTCTGCSASSDSLC